MQENSCTGRAYIDKIHNFFLSVYNWIWVQGFRLDLLLDVQQLLESNGGVEEKPRRCRVLPSSGLNKKQKTKSKNANR